MKFRRRHPGATRRRFVVLDGQCRSATDNRSQSLGPLAFVMPNRSDTRIIYLTAGAGGMFCGSCLHDNALAKALTADGWDVQLVPTYTPIRTDESDASIDHVLLGGLNVYLQQRIPLLRYMPMWVDRWLDRPGLIRWATARAMDTNAATLGSLTYSMLLGSAGNQRKEIRRTVDWLESQSPDLVVMSNLLIGGCVEPIKQRLKVPVIVTLQGDDLFLDGLQEPWRAKCMKRIRAIAGQVDAFIVHSNFYRQYMTEYLALSADKVYVTPLGIDTTDFEEFLGEHDQAINLQAITDQPLNIGYLARLAPEKGLDHLVDALLLLSPDVRDRVRLTVAGWLGPADEDYASAIWAKLDAAGWQGKYEYLGAVDRSAKLQLLRNINLFCVPTRFQEPKAIYVLEAMAAGVPVVASRHGVFPELINESGGGVLAEPNDASSLAGKLTELIRDHDRRIELGSAGRAFVLEKRNAEHMSAVTSAVFRQVLRGEREAT